MSISNSPWLTKLQYAFQDSLHLYFVMEFHPGGDMLSLLEKYDNVLPECMCQFYLAELVLAIHSLHSMGYVHRDIKPDNILIDRTGHIKLADFGSASKLNSHKQVTGNMPVGTPDYVAPEVLAAVNHGPASSRSYGVECDWWSLGIVAYEMVFGSTPFADEKVLMTYNNIMNFEGSLHFPPEATEISKTLIILIKDLLKGASNRSGYDQLIVHPFFTDVDWNNIRNTAPPYVPTVMSIDDTSNFDDFEPQSRPYLGDLSRRKEFTGKNLPFVGFTFTTPFEMNIQRFSSADDTGVFSPSSSFCEPNFGSKKKEMAALQSKIVELLANEVSLKAENDKLKANSEAKDIELEKVKQEKNLLKRIIHEKSTEVQQVKQLLSYEREHRVITEKKAAELARCMKTKQRQDAFLLRAKSLELNNDENYKNILEEKLEEALAKIDDFVRERTELLEDLEATKHTLLQCQKNYNENVSPNISQMSSGGEMRTSLENNQSSVQENRDLSQMSSDREMQSSRDNNQSSSVEENRCLSQTSSDGEMRSSQENKQSSSVEENNSDLNTVDLRRLIFKLEKKNVELERDLENAMKGKTEVEALNITLQSSLSQLQNKIHEMKEEFDFLKQNSKKVKNTVDVSVNTLEDNHCDVKEDTFSEATSGFSDESRCENQEEPKVQNMEEKLETVVNKSAYQVEEPKSFSLSSIAPTKNAAENLETVVNENACTVKQKSFSRLSMAPTTHIEIPCESIKFPENSISSERKVLQDVTNQRGSLQDLSDMKQENEYLKSRTQVLTAEIKKLKEDIVNKENSYSTFENKLKEKEAALTEAKLDLRISVRKEQQAESMTSVLRERNKELREKVKSLEDVVNEKSDLEMKLMEKIKQLESELSERNKEVTEKEKLFEIEKAKAQYTSEMSKDVSQKFAKSQDHYEEIVKQNMDLIREKEERNLRNHRLLEEIETLKKELTEEKNECAKLRKRNEKLTKVCSELDEQLDDFQHIVETRDANICDLQTYQNKLKAELKSLEEVLKVSKADMKKAEQESAKLRLHIEELNSEIDNNTVLYETEIQDLQDQLAHYKKIAEDREAQNEVLQRDLISDSSKCKSYSEKVLLLESQLCEIKEEAARHITQISSLKSSNFQLTQSLEEALENNKELRQCNEELLNELESVKVNHLHEKVKLQETLSQQTKLIDFLQSKTENMERRKKPHLSRLFGKKDNASNQAAMQYKDVEKLLETEKSRCRRLQDQLSQARAEVVAMQREMCNVKDPINVEVPQSPLSRAMHCVITQSPSAVSDSQSPVLVSRELVNKISKPPGMKHKIPHRFTHIMCMRSTKCCACLDSLHFGRTIAKCQECSSICHPSCAASLPSTCGLPIGFMKHFKTAINSCSASPMKDSEHRLSEGWIKVPKNNKLGWESRFLKLVDSVLYFFENSEETDFDKALLKLDFSPEVAKIVVTSAVSATELNFAARSDLPYVLKLEYVPLTTCWPKRCLYIMTSSYSDKHMWVSTLEALAQESNTEVDGCQKNKLLKKTIWSLKGDRLIDPFCTYILDDAIILLGAVDGLYVLKIVNKFTCSLKSKFEGLQHVYQIACVDSIGLMLLIQGYERRLTMTNLSSVRSAVQKVGNSSLISRPLADISDCHLFSVCDTYHKDMPYLCIATSKSVMLFQWDAVLKTFCNKRIFETKEPCSCIHFTPSSIIFGTDTFYLLDLNAFTVQNFLDDRDTSLAGIIYGASQHQSFPIAIFRISSSDEPVEYLMCFHEMGVFVNDRGQRTRPEDMKWSRLPLSFAYQLPYLFVKHFNSLEVIEIPPASATELGLQAVTLIKNPEYLGPAHLEQSVYMSSSHDQIIELILVDGKSIGRSNFNLPQTAGHIESDSPRSSDKESATESEGLDFSFSTSIEQSLAEISEDQISLSSKSSSESASSQS